MHLQEGETFSCLHPMFVVQTYFLFSGAAVGSLDVRTQIVYG